MPTAEAVLDFYVRNDGLGENLGVNANWITFWYGMTGAWCAMTVSRALYEAGGESLDWITEAGISMTSVKGWAYVPYLRDSFINAGRYHEGDPQYGDVVIFDWDDDGWGDHTGVFEQDLGDGTCLTREGNTSNDRLEQRRRPYSLIAGFCRPPYDEGDDDLKDDESAALKRAADSADGLDQWFRSFDQAGSAGAGDYWKGQAVARDAILEARNAGVFLREWMGGFDPKGQHDYWRGRDALTKLLNDGGKGTGAAVDVDDLADKLGPKVGTKVLAYVKAKLKAASK